MTERESRPSLPKGSEPARKAVDETRQGPTKADRDAFATGAVDPAGAGAGDAGAV